MTTETQDNTDISMEEVLGPGPGPRTLKFRILLAFWRATYPIRRFFEPRILFNGARRRASDFCSDSQLSYSGFTQEETARGEALAKPFNDKYYDEDDENSMSMYAKWMDKDGLIFRVTDDLTGSCIETVHEKDVAGYKVN